MFHESHVVDCFSVPCALRHRAAQKMSPINGVGWWDPIVNCPTWCNYVLIKNHLVDSCVSKLKKAGAKTQPAEERELLLNPISYVVTACKKKKYQKCNMEDVCACWMSNGDILGNGKECKRTKRRASVLFSSLCGKTGKRRTLFPWMPNRFGPSDQCDADSQRWVRRIQMPFSALSPSWETDRPLPSLLTA